MNIQATIVGFILVGIPLTMAFHWTIGRWWPSHQMPLKLRFGLVTVTWFTGAYFGWFQP